MPRPQSSTSGPENQPLRDPSSQMDLGPHPFLDHPHPLAFAHRGGTEAGPENTLHAFQSAYDLGFRWLETDVQLTADGVLVAVHDTDLKRVAGRDLQVSQASWAELCQVDLGDGHRIPTFAALVEALPDARWNIEPKDAGSVPPLVRMIRNRKLLDRVCIGSFSALRLRNVRRALGAPLCSSMSPLEVVRLRSRSLGLPLSRSFHPSVRCVQLPVHQRVRLPLPAGQKGVVVTDAKLIAEAHARGLQVHVWTINDADEMNRLLDLGVDGIMTDRPSVLKAVLQGRGQWLDPAPDLGSASAPASTPDPSMASAPEHGAAGADRPENQPT